VENLAVPLLFEDCSLVSLATVVVNTVGGRCQAGDDSAINHWLNKKHSFGGKTNICRWMI
jgi:hypothetical protein